MPQVSVLLPFTHERGLLSESIDSIRGQSLRDLELLLIDNAGDPDSLRIAEAAVSEDVRCRIISEKKPGIAYALNTGITDAASDIIARMDADDLAHPERLRKQCEYLSMNPHIGAVACRTHVEPATPGNEGYRFFVDWQNSLITPEDHTINRFIESPVAHPSMMMRKELFDSLGGYSTEPLPEDYELWLRWMQAGVLISKLPETLLTWRDRTDRLSRNHGNYSEDAFFRTKVKYLKAWMNENIADNRTIIVCGGSRHIRKRINLLQEAGIRISAVTDVAERTASEYLFIPVKELPSHHGSFIINLISKRDVREDIRNFLVNTGFREMKDFIMAG